MSGVHWNNDQTITLECDGQALTNVHPERAFNLVIMAAKMLRGHGFPYPYTFEEAERITVEHVRRRVEDVDDITAEAGSQFEGIDRDAIREALDDASGAVEHLNTLISQLRFETGIDR